MTDVPRANQVGRAARANPPNRFLAVHLESSAEVSQLADDDELLAERRVVPTEFLPDRSRSILTTNDSPDVGFRTSLNPYRGCEHGCAYCYARPSHETLGWGAGLDFETRILIKHDAPALLREALCKSSWRGELIALSGVTDCYQPVERRLGLTRAILEVCLEARQAVAIVTKNALVLRDLDLLEELAALRLTHVLVSVTTLDAELARRMEPRTSPPAARLGAIRKLADAGVPVRVMAAPVIPGLTDHELPAILAAAAEHGARAAGYQLLRLPLAVLPIFQAWLAREFPDRQELVESRIRATRSGQLNDARFVRRMRGEGPYAEQIAATFRVFSKRHGLDRDVPELDLSLFRPPRWAAGQMRLF